MAEKKLPTRKCCGRKMLVTQRVSRESRKGHESFDLPLIATCQKCGRWFHCGDWPAPKQAEAMR